MLPKIDKIKEWVSEGMELKAIAAKLDIGESTFRRYMEYGKKGDIKYKALSDVVGEGTEKAGEVVESALFKAATGYTTKVAKHFKVKTVKYDQETGKRIGEREELKVAYDEVHIPANVTAQMFWLSNRLPDKWKYKPAESAAGEIEDLTALADMLKEDE